MEIVEKKDHKKHLTPLVFKFNEKGRFSLTMSIVNEIEFSNKYFWLTVMGYARSFNLLEPIYRIFPRLRSKNNEVNSKQQAICFRLEFREMCLIEESGNKNWFMPNQFAIRRLTKDDAVHGKELIELLKNNKIECMYSNLKEFIGFYIGKSEAKFNRDNFNNKSISCTVSNETNSNHPDYFEINFIFDYPRYKITLKEIDIAYRQKLFNHLFESSVGVVTDKSHQAELKDDSIVQDIPVEDFGGATPSLTIRKSGRILLVVEMPPFYDGEGNDIEGDDDFPEVSEFEELISEYTGVEVERDDREIFIIDKPHPDTAKKVKEFLENYWTLRKDKYKK